MAIKTKKSKTSENLVELSRQAGMLLMSAAVTVGMLETPDRANRIVLPTQPVFGWANQNEEFNNQNVLRRESEETDQHYISYSIAQRTPSRSGSH